MRVRRFMHCWILVHFFVAITSAQVPDPQQDIPVRAPETATANINTFSAATWFARVRNLRHRLSERGASGSLLMTNDWSIDARGGGQPGESFDRCLIDLSVALDTHKLLGWEGGSALFRMHSYQGENGSARVGDAQGFSNIDDVAHTLLYELWFEQRIPRTNWRARVGKIDANALFATVESGVDFLNSSMGYSPTILKLPTYPNPRLGGNVVYDNGRFNAEFGLYDADGRGSLVLIEGGRRFSFGDDSHTRSALGIWQLRTSLPSYDDVHSFTTGLYAVQESNLRLRPAAAGHSESRLVAFVQYGHANPQMSTFANHVGAGVVWPFAFGRPDDSIGAGVMLVTFGHCPGASFDYATEPAIEFYYKIRVNRIFNLSPDTQFIHHPGGIRGYSDALVFTPRLTLTF